MGLLSHEGAIIVLEMWRDWERTRILIGDHNAHVVVYVSLLVQKLKEGQP